MQTRNYLAKLSVAGSMLIALSSAANSAPHSYAGPDSVAKFHPLCLDVLKLWQEDGGAVDMQSCAQQYQNSEVLETAEGAYYAQRPEGQPGYMAYKPIGTLDNSMELLLVYDKRLHNPITSIYFIGKIPGSELTRDFLTTIEEGGDRCLGGVNAARLISSSRLEVDLNATVHQMLTFLDDSASADTSTISFKPKNYQAYACAGIITKSYDLLTNNMHYSKVSFTRDESRKVIDKSAKCYDKFVAENLAEDKVLDMTEYAQFLVDYKNSCGAVK
ncbi:MAG: hypothetical protein MJK10_16785 [Pseudomonadales bacterium]|nr:hypothetical protein [Pseudomonadales bacterium]NRA17790.1 hypothetical protein [Oceanospirillaceae bacterium]